MTAAGRINFKQAVKNRIVRKIQGIPVAFLGLNDLVRSKKTGRLQDKSDIEALLKPFDQES